MFGEELKKQCRGPFLLCAYMVLLSGCTTYQQSSLKHLNDFRQGNSEKPIAYYTANQKGKNKQLHMVEAGRLRMLDGDFSGSHEDFRLAIEEIFDVREGSMIRLRDAGGTLLSSTFLDDRSSPYNLPSFECVMAFQYQAMNSLFLGDTQAAAVEARRAVDAQDVIAATYEREIERIKNEAKKKETETKAEKKADDKGDKEDGKASMVQVNDYYARLGPVIGRAKSAFQNPFVWYFSGLMYELQSEPGNAYIAYKKAWELTPDNVYLQRDLLRLAKLQNPEELAAFQTQFNLSSPPPPDRPIGELIIFYEEGLISQRYSEGIRLLIGGGFHSVTFPVYRDGPYQPLRVQATWNGDVLGGLMPLAYFQSLAYHDLKERIPGIAARNISRAITRQVTREIGKQSDDAIVNLLTLLGTGVISLADQADTRGWYSLPMGVQMLRMPITAGEGTLCLNRIGNIAQLEKQIQVRAGERKLVWVADMGNRSSIGVASLNMADSGNAQFERLLGDEPFPEPPPLTAASAGSSTKPPPQPSATNAAVTRAQGYIESPPAVTDGSAANAVLPSHGAVAAGYENDQTLSTN